MASGNIYDRSKAPREGKSSISAQLRQNIYGDPQQNFAEWYAQQQRGPAPGPVATASQPQNNFQQLLSNMFRPQQQAPQTQAPVGGQGSDQQLQMILDAQRELQRNDIRNNPELQLRSFQAQQQASDPVRYAQENYQARLASDPWGPGGQFAGHTAAETMSPEAILASQGNNAMNQWAQRGAVKGIDPEELQRLNASAAGRYKTYM